MYFHLDNFSIYDTVRTTGNMDLTWLASAYKVVPEGGNTNLRIQEWPSGREGLGTVAVSTGYRSIYLPLGSYFGAPGSGVERINITQRLLNYQPTGNVAICGISQIGVGSDNHILSFGFNSLKSGFVAYADVNGIVQRDYFSLSISLTGSQDVIEWTFEKTSDSRNDYGLFSLWVNNKPAYFGRVFCQVGAAAGLGARICGGVGVPAAGTTSSTGFITDTSSVSIPVCGVTDLVVNDGQRNGLVRVLSRSPTSDLGPNSMIPSEGSASHAALVGVIPPDSSAYLTAVSAVNEELYGAPAFDGLSSEAVLAVAVQVAGSKNNPFSVDLAGQVRVSGQKYDMGVLEVDLTPSFAQTIMEKNPQTGLPWTALEANSANFGLKVQ